MGKLQRHCQPTDSAVISIGGRGILAIVSRVRPWKIDRYVLQNEELLDISIHTYVSNIPTNKMSKVADLDRSPAIEHCISTYEKRH